LILNGPYNSAALLRCLWCHRYRYFEHRQTDCIWQDLPIYFPVVNKTALGTAPTPATPHLNRQCHYRPASRYIGLNFPHCAVTRFLNVAFSFHVSWLLDYRQIRQNIHNMLNSTSKIWPTVFLSIICILHKISWKSTQTFLSYPAERQTRAKTLSRQAVA